jgi:hypothetical protein
MKEVFREGRGISFIGLELINPILEELQKGNESYTENSLLSSWWL